MTTAIIYATTHGTTEKVALRMQHLLGDQNSLMINLKNIKNVDLKQYDKIIIGGSIHAGMLQKSVKGFINKNKDELLQKPLGLFICGMNVPEYQAQIERAFPESLRKHAKSVKVAGGEFLFDKMNLFQKIIVRKISGIKESVSKIDDKKIEEFIKEFND